MSKIEKMSIQGIRSFGPDEDNKQLIQFQTPLTLILGPNGTGKTTIIECLKYMTTGVMPPGCLKGGAFIHDPKVAGEREVKGQVKLQFRDISNKPLIVQRSLTATQKGKKVEMKTLDGVITRMNAAGEKQSISSKCMDLDREMISSLGVSKPVLESVIFCHQEDANWPLGEGRAVKEKFDAIFASTRYVKALESIKKTKKEQDEKLKLYRVEIQHLKQNKETAQKLEADLRETEDKLTQSKDSVKQVDEQLAPIQEKLKKIDDQSAEIYNIQNNITKWSSEKKQLDKSTAELQQQIEIEFKGSDEELKKVLADFQDKLEERQKTLKEYESQNTELSRLLEKTDREKSSILVEVGRLEQEAQRQQENVQKRDDMIKEYAEEYNFPGFQGPIVDEKYKLFLKSMQGKLEQMMNDTKQKKEEFDSRESEIQSKIDELRTNKTKLEHSVLMKKETMAENREKVKVINRKLSAIEASSGRLDQIKLELRRHEVDLETQEGSVNPEDLKKEIASLTKEKAAREAKISELNSEMNKLTLQSSAQAELDMYKKEMVTKQENVRRLRAKRESMIKNLLGTMPSDSKIREEIEEYISNQTNEVHKSRSKMQQINNSLSQLEAQRKMYMEQNNKKEGELKGLEERVYKVCGSQNFDEGLSLVQDKVEKARVQRGSLLGAEHFFKKYKEDLEKLNPCCPLCHRAFDSDQEVKDLVLELRENLRKVPVKLEKATKEVEEYQEQYDQIMQLKPLRAQMEVLEKEELPTLKTSLKRCQDETHKLKEQLADVEEALDIQDSDAQMAKEAQPDIVMIDRYQGEVVELERKIRDQSAKLVGGGTGRTLQKVIEEKEELQIQVDDASKQLDRKRNKLNEHMESVQVLRATITSLREEKLGIENDLQQRLKLEEDKGTLEAQDSTLDMEIKEATEQLRPLEKKINGFIKEKEASIAEKEEKIEIAKAE
ncbi:hypothetical protein DPMN_117302, partial [Dreissena polymorpha]